MYLKQGEVRRIGIEVMSQVNDNFMIDTAGYKVINASNNTVLESGIPTIDEHKIMLLFSAREVGKYYIEFEYHIGPEILKANIYMEVK